MLLKNTGSKTTSSDNRDGYTLSEAVIVIIILSILSTIALPKYFNTVERAKATEGYQILEAVLKAQKVYYFENNGSYASDIDDLEVSIPPPTYFDPPSAIAGTGNIVGKIVRKSPSYQLEINNTGTITCSDYLATQSTCDNICGGGTCN